MKKWFKDFRNFMLVHFIFLLTLPLLTLGMCNFLTGCISIGLYIFGVSMILFSHFYTSDKAVQNRLKRKAEKAEIREIERKEGEVRKIEKLIKIISFLQGRKNDK